MHTLKKKIVFRSWTKHLLMKNAHFAHSEKVHSVSLLRFVVMLCLMSKQHQRMPNQKSQSDQICSFFHLLPALMGDKLGGCGFESPRCHSKILFGRSSGIGLLQVDLLLNMFFKMKYFIVIRGFLLFWVFFFFVFVRVK